MIRQDCIPLESPAAWKDALIGVKHAFAHTWENCYAMHLTTGFKTYLYCFESENARILCPIAERMLDGQVDIVTPYGFSGFVGNRDCADFPHHWKQFVRDRGYVCGYIGQNPLFRYSTYYQPYELYQNNAVYVLDLTLSHEELFFNLSTNRKRQLRDWTERFVDLSLKRSELTDFLLSHYLEFFHRKGASRVYNFSSETMKFLLGLDTLLVVGKRGPQGVEAVSVFAYTSDVAEYLFNVSLPEGAVHSVALMWEGVNCLKYLNIPFLNLGGGIHENDGVAAFKERFGGRKFPLTSLKQVYDPATYEQLCRTNNADPKDLKGYFPPYRRGAGTS